MTKEFKPFPKIPNLDNMKVVVTQKLHGTNASLWIDKLDGTEVLSEAQKDFITTDGKYLVMPAKRTSFINLYSDNFGFAKFTHENRDALAVALGEGTWFGEWVGPGINSGEGLREKRLALFSIHLKEKVWQMKKANLWPERVDLVPVLFEGKAVDLGTSIIMSELTRNGSRYAPGFMRPEGIVIHILGTGISFKEVFELEETQWRKPDKSKEQKDSERKALPDVSHLLQPIRLEKLLSRDSQLIEGLPQTLGTIVKEYVNDLEVEGQLSEDEDFKAVQKRALGRAVFSFVKDRLLSIKLGID